MFQAIKWWFFFVSVQFSFLDKTTELHFLSLSKTFWWTSHEQTFFQKTLEVCSAWFSTKISETLLCKKIFFLMLKYTNYCIFLLSWRGNLIDRSIRILMYYILGCNFCSFCFFCTESWKYAPHWLLKHFPSLSMLHH